MNSQDQLADAEAELRRRINQELAATRGLDAGPRAGLHRRLGRTRSRGAALSRRPSRRAKPGSRQGAVVGPDMFVVDSTIGAGARVWYSVLRSAQVGEGAEVGPYASLRPGTVLESHSKAGTFVETKNSRIGEGAKVPHLSYIGDATIGAAGQHRGGFDHLQLRRISRSTRR